MPLRERQSLDAEAQGAIRAALVRRHAQVLDEQHAIDATEIAMETRGPAFRSMAKRLRG